MTIKRRLERLEKIQVAGDPKKPIKVFEFATDGKIYDFKTRQVYSELEYKTYQDQHPEIQIIQVTYHADPIPEGNKP